jgi:ribosomal-protein-serine acetyltransferase
VIVVDGRIAGEVGHHRVDWHHRSTSIGYWLASVAQGRGTMTRAVRALVDWAFRGWGLNRVEVLASPGNARSRAVAERLGFTEEGTLRQAERVGERYLDNVVCSVLASEWGRTTALPSNRPARRSASASSARSSS